MLPGDSKANLATEKSIRHHFPYQPADMHSCCLSRARSPTSSRLGKYGSRGVCGCQRRDKHDIKRLQDIRTRKYLSVVRNLFYAVPCCQPYRTDNGPCRTTTSHLSHRRRLSSARLLGPQFSWLLSTLSLERKHDFFPHRSNSTDHVVSNEAKQLLCA